MFINFVNFKILCKKFFDIYKLGHFIRLYKFKVCVKQPRKGHYYALEWMDGWK